MAKQLTTISLSRKKELERPDDVSTFLSRVFAYCVENQKTILMGLGGVMALALIVSGYRFYMGRSEEKASAILAGALHRYEAAVEKQDARQALAQVREDFNTIESRFGRTRVAGFARMHAAGMHYDAGEFQQSAILYENMLKRMKTDHPFRVPALIGMGYAREAMGDAPAAIRYLEEALSLSEHSMKGEIRFHLARLYAAQGLAEKSMEAYRRIVTEDADSLYYDMARNLVGG